MDLLPFSRLQLRALKAGVAKEAPLKEQLSLRPAARQASLRRLNKDVDSPAAVSPACQSVDLLRMSCPPDLGKNIHTRLRF